MKNIITRLTWLIMLAPVIYLAIIWGKLPATIAMHFDLQGNPDRYGSKKELIGVTAIMIAVNLFVYFLLTNIHRIDPKKRAIENRERLNRIAMAVSIFLSALLFVIIYSSLKGSVQVSMGMIFSGIGLLYAIIGNYMPNMKPNYFAGFRLPWTLENEENWRKTHALAGKLWFGGGVLIAVVCLLLPPVISMIFFFTVTIVITIIPAVYSFRQYKQKKSITQ